MAKRMKYFPTFALLLLSFTACKTSTSGLKSDTVLPDATVDLTQFKIESADDKKLFRQFELELKNANYKYEDIVKKVEPLVAAGPSRIRTMLSGDKIDMHELAAIYFYTTDAYPLLNGPLRRADRDALKKWSAMIRVASSGLNKLPGTACKARRGTDLPEDLLRQLNPQARFNERAFFSTTSGSIPGAFIKSIEMEISSDSCKDVSWISHFPNEKEILFSPGSEFVVTDRKSCVKGVRKLCFYLKQVSGAAADALILRQAEGTEEPSPGTKGMGESFRESNFTHRTYRSQKDLNKYVYFETTRKGTWVNTAGENKIHNWVLDRESNLIEVTYSRPGERSHKTAWFFVLDTGEIGYLKGPASDQVQEYYRFQ